MIFAPLLLLLLSPCVFGLVWNPDIYVPNAATRWRAGGSYTVTWNTTVYGEPIPNEINGTIMLGYLEEGSINEHLYWKLASGFPLNKGHQRIKLPRDLETKNSYIIVLMGDSGNASPKFTIKAAR